MNNLFEAESKAYDKGRKRGILDGMKMAREAVDTTRREGRYVTGFLDDEILPIIDALIEKETPAHYMKVSRAVEMLIDKE